jgi:hypothetical protein
VLREEKERRAASAPGAPKNKKCNKLSPSWRNKKEVATTIVYSSSFSPPVFLSKSKKEKKGGRNGRETARPIRYGNRALLRP